LSVDLTLEYAEATIPLECADAFAFDLKVLRQPIGTPLYRTRHSSYGAARLHSPAPCGLGAIRRLTIGGDRAALRSRYKLSPDPETGRARPPCFVRIGPQLFVFDEADASLALYPADETAGAT
jgi:hypothetical protein